MGLGRPAVLNERARRAIHDYRTSLGRMLWSEGFLFLSRQGGNRPIDCRQAHRMLRNLYRACGVDEARVSTPSLRKTFVRADYDASQHDLIRTQRIVGHSSPVVPARYLESTESEMDNLILGLAGRPHSPARP